MPLLLNNPAHWHLRAQEARLLALQLKDPEANATVLKIADEYDHLAVRATVRTTEAMIQSMHPEKAQELAYGQMEGIDPSFDFS